MQKIMFNDRYVLTDLVLRGVKTQTRRIINLDDIDVDNLDVVLKREYGNKVIQSYAENRAKYKVGEIVAVAQAYKDCGIFDVYRAPEKTAGWTNKMFVKPTLMPHQIRIAKVWVERLQDISDEDCIKEGVGKAKEQHLIGYPIAIPFNYFIGEDKRGNRYVTARDAFSALIDKVSGKGTWERNPYVFCYEFELVK